jgi:hypothetical protein
VHLVTAAILGLTACGLGQAYCHGAPSGPEAGTAGLRYWTKVAPAYNWTAYAAAGVMLVFVVMVIAGRRQHQRRLAVGDGRFSARHNRRGRDQAAEFAIPVLTDARESVAPFERRKSSDCAPTKLSAGMGDAEQS